MQSRIVISKGMVRNLLRLELSFGDDFLGNETVKRSQENCATFHNVFFYTRLHATRMWLTLILISCMPIKRYIVARPYIIDCQRFL